jgi:hypothetical protein
MLIYLGVLLDSVLQPWYSFEDGILDKGLYELTLPVIKQRRARLEPSGD